MRQSKPVSVLLVEDVPADSRRIQIFLRQFKEVPIEVISAETLKKEVPIEVMSAETLKEAPKKLSILTDKGSQYASDSHRRLLREQSISQSMSRKGNC